MVPPVRPDIGKEQYLSKSEGISGKLRKTPQHFSVDEVIQSGREAHWIWAKESNEGKHAIVKITSTNWDTHVLVKELSKKLNIGERAISFAGTKDKRARTSQYMSLKCSQEKIEDLDLDNVKIEFKHMSTKPIRLGNLVGNKFKIEITEAKNLGNIDKIITELDQFFPNYFGIQRFGVMRPITHLVGKKIVEGNYKEAVWDYLTIGDENTSGHEGRQFLIKTKNWKEAIGRYSPHLLFERQLLGHLSRNEKDYVGAINQLPENLAKMLVHGYQSLIFNRVLDLRIKEGISINTPLIGDNIIPVDNYGGPDQRRVIEVTNNNQKKLTKRCLEGKAWVVGLLPGAQSNFTKGPQGKLEQLVMKEEKIKFEDFMIEEIPQLSSLGMYRPLSQKINDLKYRIRKNGNPYFQFWLHKGTYATSFLREIMKSGDLRSY